MRCIDYQNLVKRYAHRFEPLDRFVSAYRKMNERIESRNIKQSIVLFNDAAKLQHM